MPGPAGPRYIWRMAISRTAARDREKPLRLFFALWPDEDTGSALAALAREVAAAQGGKPPPPANMHLTLAFLGDVSHERVDALAPIGAAAAQAVPPFSLILDRVGGFRDKDIAWLGTATMPAALGELARQLRKGLAGDRFPVERRAFAAHVTLARNCRTALPRARRIEPVSWPVQALTLVVSQLAAGGSRYHTLTTWPLGPPS